MHVALTGIVSPDLFSAINKVTFYFILFRLETRKIKIFTIWFFQRRYGRPFRWRSLIRAFKIRLTGTYSSILTA